MRFFNDIFVHEFLFNFNFYYFLQLLKVNFLNYHTNMDCIILHPFIHFDYFFIFITIFINFFHAFNFTQLFYHYFKKKIHFYFYF
jgi:hypothetical protein